MEPVVHVEEGGDAAHKLINREQTSLGRSGSARTVQQHPGSSVQDAAYFWPGLGGAERAVRAGVLLVTWLTRKVFIYFSAKHVVG